MDEFGGIPVDDFGGVLVEEAPTPKVAAVTPVGGGPPDERERPETMPVPSETPPLGAFGGPPIGGIRDLLKTGFAVTPAKSLPRFNIPPTESVPLAVGKEALNIAAGIPEFLSSPLGLVTMGAAAVAPTATAAAFTLDMAKNLGKQILSTYEDWGKMTPAQKAVAITDIAGTGFMGMLTGRATVKGLNRMAKPEVAQETLPTETPPVIPEPKPTPKPEPPPPEVQPELQTELAKELAVEPEPIPETPAVSPVERAPAVEKAATTPIEAPSPERPPKNPFRLYLKEGENMNDFLKRASDEELVEAQRNGDLWEKYLKEEQDYRKSTKDATWKDLNPMLYDANHFTTDVNWERVRRSAEAKPSPGTEGKAEPTVPPTTPTVSEATQVSAIPEPAAASAIREAKPIEEVSQEVPSKETKLPKFFGRFEAGETLPSGERVIGNFARKKDAEATGGTVEGYLNGKYKRGWIAKEQIQRTAKPAILAPPEAKAAGKATRVPATLSKAEAKSEVEKVQTYASGMVQSVGNYIRRTIDSGKTAKEAALEWAKEIGSGLMDTPDEIYRKERGGLYSSTYVKGILTSKEGVAVNAGEYLKAIDAAREKSKAWKQELINRQKALTQAPPEAKPVGMGGVELPVGPGAASPGDVPKAPQIVQLTEEFKRIEAQKVPFAEKVKEWFNLSEHRSLAQNAFARSLDALKTSRDYLIKKWDGVKDWDDIKRVKGELSAEINTRGWTLKQFEKQTRKSIPRRRDREAISSWLDNGGDPAKLQTALAEAPERYKQSYRDALNLSPDLKLAAEHARSYFEARLQEAMDAGVLEDGITDYIHRIYKRDTPVKQRILNSVQSGVLNTRTPGLAMQRAFQFDYEAEKAGYPIVKDFLPRLVDYEYSLSRVIADRAAVKRFMEIRMGDQRPMIDVAGIGIPVENAEGITETMLIKPQVKPGDPTNPGAKGYRKDYVERNDYPAFRKWKWASKDPDTGRDIFVQGDVLVHPEAAARIDALMARSAIRRNPLGAAALGVSSTFKQTMLDFSGFHQVQIAVHGLEHRVTPFNIVKDIDVMDPKIQGLLKGGLNIGGESHAFDYREGLVGRSLSRMIPGLGELMQSYHEYLFRDYIPRIKTTMALHALERNRARMPGLSEEQLNYLTAKQANAAFGGLNYILMERGKTAQDLSRLILLAPDFLEARGSFALQALQRIGKSGDVTKGIAPWANEQRMALLLGALTMYVTARVVNKMLNDQYHFEPENAFSIVHGGHSYSLRTVQGDLLHLWDKPFQFWLNRLNPVFGRSFLELGTGRDYFGRKRSRMELAWDLFANIRPIAFRDSPERRLWESVANAFGIQAKRWSDTDGAFKLAQAWKEKNGIGERGEFIYDAEKDPLRPLKIALSHENEAEAAKQIGALFAEGYKRERLTQYFKRYAVMPFTGSKANDVKWRKTLSRDELKTVETAAAHRKAIQRLYTKALGQYDAARLRPIP